MTFLLSIRARQPGFYEIRYEAHVRVQADLIPAGSLMDAGPAAFEAPVLPYLYPRRYCQSDRLGQLSFDLISLEPA